MPIDLLSGPLRHRQAVVSSALAAVIVASWAYLLRGAGIEMAMMDMGGGLMMAMPPEWSLAYAALIFVMWVVMMVAMMLPSAAPTVLSRQKSWLFQRLAVPVWFPTDKNSLPTDSGIPFECSSTRRTASSPALRGLIHRLTNIRSTGSERRTRFSIVLQREPTPPLGP